MNWIKKTPCILGDINESNLNKNFNSLCDWFVENKLSIHFGDDKTKTIVFGSKRRLRMLDKLDIRRDETKISQCNKIPYLGCILDDNLSGESMASRVLNKVGGRLNFLYRKESFLNLKLLRMLCNALIQPHFSLRLFCVVCKSKQKLN